MFNTDTKVYSRSSDRGRTKRRRSSVGTSTSESKSPCRESNLIALVVDSGAYSIKVGLSTEESPEVVPNCIMKAKAERKRLFIGNQIHECRDCSGLYFLLPCERGYITKWDVQKPVWDYIFSKNTCPINENPVVVTQPLFNFKSIQDCMDEIFFEEYEVPSMFRLNPSDLAKLQYAEDHKLSEDVPCIIVDSGFSFTHVIPYINGNKYLNGIRRLNVGGKLLTNHLKDIISYRQYNVMEETYVINQVKEDTCYVAEDIKEELKLAAKSGKVNHIVKNYVLPDFNNIRRGYIRDPSNIDQKELEENCQILRLNNERFIVPEILIHPSDIGMKCMGIAEAVVKSISCCPTVQQEALAKNIVLVGGNCKFPGFRERMYAEIRYQLPHLWEVNVFLPDDPATYSWKGGGPLLKIRNFKSFLVTREEYEELGSTIIQQRFNTFMTDNSIFPEETKKNKEEYRYLDRLKGKSIFGKQEQEMKTLVESCSVVQENCGSGTPVSSLDDPNSANGSEDTSQDSFQQPPFDLDPGGKAKKITKHTGQASVKTLEDEGCNSQEADLRYSVELFPFGTDSYL